MTISINTARMFSTGLFVLFCFGYLIYFFTVFKQKHNFQIKNMFLEDKKRFLGITNLMKLNIEKIKKWWTTRLVPGVIQISETLWVRNSRLGDFLEIIIIFIWAIYVGRAYLDMNLLTWPSGGEFPSSIQTGYIWTNFIKCGACVFWNGFSHGGAPGFADMQGSMLHPLVIILTLLKGALNGAKLTIIGSLIIAGFAQWWLSKVLGFGRIPRVWSGLIAVVGGHLAARMELGAFGVVLSTAACSLVLAPGIGLGLTGKRHYTILLGVTIGLALLSGQGYMQVGLLLGMIPTFLIFILGREDQFKNLWKEYLLAGFLGFLIAGIFLIPMIHFYPNMAKNEDPTFEIAQILKYIPLNHLIDNVGFYFTDQLKPTPYPYLYANFLGWTPIILAIVVWRYIPKSRLRLMFYFLVSIILIYLIASADLLKLLVKIFPFVAGVRNSPQIAGLANPLILGLSAWGLDVLLHVKWPKIALINGNSSSSIFSLNTAIIILSIPLIWSLREAYVFGHDWLSTVQIEKSLYQKVDLIKTDVTEWVNLPFGAHYWQIPAFENSLKISNAFRTWSWKSREDPPIYQEATFDVVDPSAPNLIRVIDGLNYLSHFENEYAYIQNGDQIIPCNAKSSGGNINVVCPESEKGQLVVTENNWTGWYAWVDQTRTQLLPSNWLSVDAPAGKHSYQFRYRPWDVWVGIFLTISGIALSIILWRRGR